MTNFEKWKKKLSEAKDSYELIKTIHEMNMALDYCSDCAKCDGYCNKCEARWFDKEVKE